MNLFKLLYIFIIAAFLNAEDCSQLKKLYSSENFRDVYDIIIINLLTKRSDKYPIGHWNKAPEIVIKNKYNEISNTEKFIKAPYTDPIVNIAGWINPVQNILTVANGEIL